MKKLLSAAWLLLALAVSGIAVEQPFLNNVAKGWKEVEALDPMGRKPPLPTIRYVPTDGRNASLLITVTGKGKISDPTGLRSVHEMACRQYLTPSNQRVEAATLVLPHARGLWSTFEDPDLIGKPPIRENYKFTTPVVLLFEGGTLAHATIFADERTGRTFDEAMAMLKSVELKPAVAKNPPPIQPHPPSDLIIISRPGLDATLGLPKTGLIQMPSLGLQGDSYFSYVRNDQLMISGWLEPVSNYPGFKILWESDKKKLALDPGEKIQTEKFEIISGWQVVTYVIQSSSDTDQWNLRASRTWGRTWADVHLSSVNPALKADGLREFLKKITLHAADSTPPADSSRL